MNATYFVQQYIQSVEAVMRAADTLAAMRAQYDLLDLGNTLQDNDVPGGLGLAAADVISGVAAADGAIAAIRTTPLAKLRQNM